MPQASTAPPAASVSAPARAPAKAAAPAVAPAQTPAARSVADMSESDKLVEAFTRAKIARATRDKILSLFTPKALVIAILSFAAVFIASQFTPVGWAADIGIALTAIFIGSALITALDHLVKFADARNATRDEELDQAGEEFAQAVAEIEIDAILLFLTHGIGGPKAGARLGRGRLPRGLVLAIPQGGGVVAVAASTITAEEAARLGLKAAGASSPPLAMMSQNGSGGGSSGPQSQQTPQATPQQSGASGPSAASGGPKGTSKLVEIADARPETRSVNLMRSNPTVSSKTKRPKG